MNKKYFIILIFIILAGLFLRIYPFEVKSWISDFDTLVVKEALDLGQGFFEKDFSFLKKGVEYPFVIPYILLLFYGIFYFIGTFVGLFQSAHDFISYLFFNINDLYWHSRILIGVFGSLTILFVYLIVKKIFSKSEKKNISLFALISSCFVAFSLLNVQFSQQIRPHVAVGFFLILSFYLYLISIEKKTFLSFILLAISVGLATGTFFTGFFSFLFLILSNYFFFNGNNKFKFKKFFRSIFTLRFLCASVIVLFLIFVFYPFLLFNSSESERFFVEEGEEGVVMSLGGLPFPIYNLGQGFITMFKVFSLHEIGMGLSLILLILIFILSKKKEEKGNNSYFNQNLIGLLAFILPYGLAFGLFDDLPRYRLLVPFISFAAIAMGVFLIIGFNQIKEGKIKKLVLILIILFLVLQFVQAFRLTQLIANPYSRDLASDWIKENIPLDQLIVVNEHLPTLIPNKESLERKLFFDGELSRKELFLASINEEFYPLESKNVVDFGLLVNYKEKDKEAALQLLQELKPVYFVLSSRSIDADRNENNPEFYFGSEQGELIKKFSPFKDEEIKRSLNFPSGFDNPLIDLWEAERLGPFVEIYKLTW